MKKTFYILLSTLFSCIVFHSCEEESLQAPESIAYSTLVGYVITYDEFGAFITDKSDILVEIDGADPYRSAETDEDGGFQIDSIPAGTYDVVFSKSGYGTYKSVGSVFYGNNKSRFVYGYLSERSSTEVYDLSITYEPNSALRISGYIYPSATTQQRRYVRYFISNTSSVSQKNYIVTSVVTTSTDQFITTFPLDAARFPSGSTVYVKAYGAVYNESYYPNIETGLYIYPSVNTNGSSGTVSITVP